MIQGRVLSWILLLVASAAAGCGSTAAPEPADSSDADAAADVAAAPDGGAGAGSGTVSGSADGTPFDTVGSSYVLGAPDSASTTVVYVFSVPVPCSALQTPGWDKVIPNGTKVLEMKMFGNSPGTFTAVTTVTPAPGEAAVNYTLSSTSGTPKETGASGGTVTLTKLVANGPAEGSFALQFPAGSLNGSYVATYCPGGHEP